MALIPYEPFRALDPLWSEMEKFIRRGKEEWSDWMYRVDVEETATEVIATMEIAGIERKEDIYIQVNDNVLTVQGEVRKTVDNEKRVTRHTERYYGQFSRTVTLPARVKTDGAHASYRNGILELRFKKDEHPAARRIEVDFH